MRKLFSIKGEAIPSGIHPSLPNQQVPVWEDGDNVVFEEEAVKPGAGQSSIFSKPSNLAGLGALEVLLSGTRNLFWGSRQALYRGIEGTVDPVDVTRITGGGAYTGDDGDLWSLTEFGNQVVATNKIDQAQVFLAGASDFDDFDNQSDLPTAFRAGIVRKLGPFIIFFNTNNDQKEFRWCDEDDLTTFTPEANNMSRDEIIRDLDSEILCVEPLVNGLGVYGKDQLFLVSFIGPPFFFGWNRLLDGIGAVGKAAVTRVGRQHYGFGPDGIFVTDGATFEYIDSPSIHKHIYTDTLDRNYADRAVTWHDREEMIVYFAVPSGDGEGSIVGFNYKKRVWTTHGFYRTAATSGAIWDNPIAISSSGMVLQQGVQGVPVQGEAQEITVFHRSTMRTAFGMLGFGEGGFGGEWYEPGPLEGDSE
jgi:hypothetical protein